MNETLCKLIDCMRSYEVEVMYGGQKFKLIGMNETYFILLVGSSQQYIFKSKCKPILKSVLSEEELGNISVMLGAKKTNSDWVKGWLSGQDDVLSGIEAKEVMDYLYSIHWYFGIKKSLFIEKT